MSAKPLVLVLEDDAASADALAFVLRDWGADVVAGRDAIELDQALGARSDDVARWIIADFYLGAGPDGVSLARGYSARNDNAHVLVLSGGLSDKPAHAAADAGFSFMRKPVRAETIVAWLESR